MDQPHVSTKPWPANGSYRQKYRMGYLQGLRRLALLGILARFEAEGKPRKPRKFRVFNRLQVLLVPGPMQLSELPPSVNRFNGHPCGKRQAYDSHSPNKAFCFPLRRIRMRQAAPLARSFQEKFV
jgi:hypothetical protein